MKIVDLNVLLYAVNKGAAQHRRAIRWWVSAMEGDEPVGLTWIVLVGFLRLSTRPRVFPDPLSIREAIRCVQEWLAHPNVKLLHEPPGHWALLRGLMEETGTAGNLTTDAHLAAIAMGYGAVLVSCDADFARYPGLRWENPLAKSGGGGA